MSLSTQSLYATALREVGGGVGSDTFNDSFINAVNCALDELSDEADLATRITHITAVGSTITSLNTFDWYILYAGVIYFLIRMGNRPSDPKTAMAVYQDSERRWENAKGNYSMRATNALNACSTDDVTKWGHLTDT